jgi:hypothetical protein
METAYIPMKFGNGKVLLVANADIENIFNWQTADLNIFPYSSKYGVPIEKIVVVKHENNGYDEVDFEQDPSNAKVKTKITIYEWNGKNLIKKKEL